LPSHPPKLSAMNEACPIVPGYLLL